MKGSKGGVPFQPGDVVVCIDARAAYGWASGQVDVGLVEGHHYRVRCVVAHMDCDGTYGIEVEGVNLLAREDFYPAFAHTRFRKIDAADESFIAEMRALKPVKQGQPA